MTQKGKAVGSEALVFEVVADESVTDDDYFEFMNLCNITGLNTIDCSKEYTFNYHSCKQNTKKTLRDGDILRNIDCTVRISGHARGVYLKAFTKVFGGIRTSLVSSCVKKGDTYFIETLNSIYTLKEKK